MENFLNRLERTTLSDAYGSGENLRKSLSELMEGLVEEQPGDNLRDLMRQVLETEAGLDAIED